ncbi:hypothetical protein JMUB7555_26820 [Staphylococcus aureus]
MQPILRVFNTLKHIHTNTSTHLSATKIKMTLFLYVSRQEETRFQLVSKTFQKPSIHKNTTRMTLKIQDYN